MSIRAEWQMHCPSCGRADELHIEAVVHMDVQLCEGGTDDDAGGDREWDSQSGARCSNCNWNGTVRQAEKAYQKAVKAASKALGGSVDDVDQEVVDDKLGVIFDAYKVGELPALKAELKATQKSFADAGGRGVELADEVDRLAVAVVVLSTLKPHKRLTSTARKGRK